jgi:hypothetical protein
MSGACQLAPNAKKKKQEKKTNNSKEGFNICIDNIKNYAYILILSIQMWPLCRSALNARNGQA